MFDGWRSKVYTWLFLLAATFAVSGCGRQSPPPVNQGVAQKVEEPVSPLPLPQSTEELDSKQLAKLPPPKPAEIDHAVKRVFKDAAIADTSHEPYFLVGDFNGDHSQDIAVVIKPIQGKASEMNQEFPPWILKDPFNPNLPPQLRKEPLRVEENDLLLAVIHGFGPDGWRNSEATQTYLLKNAVGSNISSQPAKASVAAYKGKRIPALYGDTISQVLGDTHGFLYYAGASYAWYDPKTFKPETEQRMAHSGIPIKK